MTWLVTIGLTNAVLAALLALVAWLVGRWAKRPALTHVLWVLALIKLLTPPVFEVPVGWRIDPAVFAEAEPAVVAVPTRLTPPAALIPVNAVACDPPGLVTPTLADAESCVDASPAAALSPTISTVPRTATLVRLITSPANWLRVAIVVWAAGSLAMAGLFVSRTRRFRRFLNLAARPDEELSDRLAELARSARLPACPHVLSVESTISPMLFGLGRSVVLIFPAGLSRQLAPAARDTLLLHELAHYARGDHWVRLVELLAQVIFWWHPVVWWARRELEAAEEECCDAWVVERQAGVPRLYAEALLATIDFLCDTPTPLPPAACGLGDVPFLRARLTQIIRGRLAAQLSPATKTAVFLAAVFVLPIGPALFGASVSTESPTPTIDVDFAPAVAVVEPIAPSLPTQPQQSMQPVAAFSESPTVAAIAALVRPPRQAELYATAVSPDGQFRLEARTGFQVALVRLADNSRLAFATDPLVKCASFSPNSLSFATGHDNSNVKIYDCLAGGHIKTLKGASAAISTVAFSPDGKRVAAGAADGSVTLWDVESGEASALLGPRAAPISCLRWSRDGGRLAVSLGDLREPEAATLIICAADDGRILGQHALAEPAGAIDWTAGDRAILVADWSGAAAVWRVSDGLVLAQLPLDKKTVSAANWSPDCPLTTRDVTEQLFVRAAP